MNITYSLASLVRLISTASGNIISQIPSLTGYATEAWVSGQIPSLAGYATEGWVTDQLATVSGTSGNVTGGSSAFTGVDSYAVITHNLNNSTHFIQITPAGTGAFSSDTLAEVGDFYVRLGANEDHVYNTGGPTSSGIPFVYMISH